MTQSSSDSVAGSAKAAPSELAKVLHACRGAFVGIFLFSGMINVLMLTGAIFMLQVYDRVLPSRSLSTLVALAVIAVALFVVLGILEAIRMRLLTRVGATLDEAVGEKTYAAVIRLPLTAGPVREGLQPLRDLDTIRSFFSGQGPTALFDLPWMPVYLAILFLFHPVLGWVAVGGAVVLAGFAVLTELSTRQPIREATEAAALRTKIATAGRHNAEAVAAMGMVGRTTTLWARANAAFLASNQQVSDRAGTLGATSRTFRMMLQSAVLGVGAVLVLQGQASAGIIIAGSILVARALAPIDSAIAHWRGFIGARQSWKRLDSVLSMVPAHDEITQLPAPAKHLKVDQLGVVPPGQTQSVIQEVSFAVNAGQGLGIVGPSGSGKSSLARALVNVWQAERGSVRLDGAALTQWSPEALGRHLGYLPQNVELFAGTIAQNIARFEPDAPSEEIIAAAQAADVHDLIVSLPDGYDTELGEHGQALSAGQRQRVALARALYRRPFLLVLDEPNAHLDGDGEAALNTAIRNHRAGGGIAIVIAHRKAALAEVDMMLVMSGGGVAAFGDKEKLLAQSLRAAVKPRAPEPVALAAGGAR